MLDMIKYLRFTILILISALSTGGSAQQLKVAILDPVIAGEKLTDGLQISVREMISSAFVNYGDNYSIVERSLLDKVMQEANFSNSDAVDESQATRLGKLAGADKVVLSVVSRFDNRCMVSIKMINVETATIERQISKLVDYNSLLDVAEPLTLAVLGKGDGNISTASAPSYGSSSRTGSRQSQVSGNRQVSSGAVQSSTSLKAPEFNGAGLAFSPTGFNLPAIYNEDLVNMGLQRLLTDPYVNLVFDFSGTKVMGMDLLTFIEQKRRNDPKSAGKDFFATMMSECNRFVEAANDQKYVTFSYNPDAPVTLVVKVQEIDEPGRVNTSDYAFVETNTGNYLGGMRIKSKGGRFGSFTNLFGDAMEEDAAPKLVKNLKSVLKKIKKGN